MSSVTKIKLSQDDINKITKKAFNKDIVSLKELTGGFYNSAYDILLEDGLQMVLKVAPSPDIKVLRCERNIMRTEVEVLQLIRSCTNVPVPDVLYVDQEYKYFFMEYIQGTPLDELHPHLNSEQFYTISEQLGTYTKQINSITSDAFGQTFSKQQRYNTWSVAFIAMIEEIILDANDAKIILPICTKELKNIVVDKSPILDTIGTPRLVHRDLWWGNIFIDPETLTITGITDFERSLFGDPLMDIVFGFAKDNEGFKKGMGRNSAFSKDEECLLSLYQIYFVLLIILEGHYRQLKDNEQNEQHAQQVLIEEIQKLKNL
nr:aminoglycoside 3'-phosphotransferase/choline kinase family protein [Paenibacillus bovis]